MIIATAVLLLVLQMVGIIALLALFVLQFSGVLDEDENNLERDNLKEASLKDDSSGVVPDKDEEYYSDYKQILLDLERYDDE